MSIAATTRVCFWAEVNILVVLGLLVVGLVAGLVMKHTVFLPTVFPLVGAVLGVMDSLVDATI